MDRRRRAADYSQAPTEDAIAEAKRVLALPGADKAGILNDPNLKRLGITKADLGIQ